ncbi:MAG: hypothetical protein KAH20_16475 [Methylococcales bacterium]|nr:hypothetical protein [Methylococcales bacterium]
MSRNLSKIKKQNVEADISESMRNDAPKNTSDFPWKNENVREDIIKTYNLRLSEPYLLKLKFISENTPQSMQKFCITIIEREIDKKINEITQP